MLAFHFTRKVLKTAVPKNLISAPVFRSFATHTMFKSLYFLQINRLFSIEVEYAAEISDVMKEYETRMARKQALLGIVTSTKCTKSVTVTVTHETYISKYNKFIRRDKKIMAHDEEDRGRLGDFVRIIPCRPRSKKKRHALLDIIRRHESSKDDAPKIEAVVADQAAPVKKSAQAAKDHKKKRFAVEKIPPNNKPANVVRSE